MAAVWTLFPSTRRSDQAQKVLTLLICWGRVAGERGGSGWAISRANIFRGQARSYSRPRPPRKPAERIPLSKESCGETKPAAYAKPAAKRNLRLTRNCRSRLAGERGGSGWAVSRLIFFAGKRAPTVDPGRPRNLRHKDTCGLCESAFTKSHKGCRICRCRPANQVRAPGHNDRLYVPSRVLSQRPCLARD